MTLFSESAGRVVVSVRRGDEARLAELCTSRGIAHQRLGQVDLLEAAVDVADQFRIPLRELRAAWTSTVPARFAR